MTRQPSPALLVLLYGAALCWAIWFAFAPRPQPPAPWLIDHAVRDGRPADLPALCRSADQAVGCRMTFEVNFTHAAGMEGPWALYLPGYSSRLEVRLNGYALFDTRLAGSPGVLTQTVPLFIPLPDELLRQGSNALRLTVATWGPLSGYLSPVAVGPADALRAYYAPRAFQFVTLPRLMLSWQIAFAAILLTVWWARRRESAYLLFGLVLVCEVVGQAPLLIDVSGWSLDQLRLLHLVFVWKLVLLAHFAFHYTETPRPRWLPWLWLLPVAATMAFTALPHAAFAAFARALVFPAAFAVLLLGAGVFVRAAWRRGGWALHGVAAVIALSLVFSVHDVLVTYNQLTADRVFLGRLAMMGLLTVVGLLLIRRFAHALNRVDRFNERLRGEIAGAEAALRESLERQQAQRAAMWVARERERLTGDLHDGLAGQLLSIAAQCESPDADLPAVGQSARRALDDLRLVIDSLDDVGDDLATMLATFRDRIAPLLRAHAIALDWRMSHLPLVPGLHPSLVLEIFRILQEAVTNAVRHAGSDRLTIAVSPHEGGVRVQVIDYGSGSVAPREGGYGLASMQRRANAIGARLAITADGSGTRVTLGLPGQFPPND